MKRSVILVLFIVVLAGIFVWLAVNRDELSLTPETRANVKTIIPSAENKPAENVKTVDENASYDESKTQPLITLEDDETFLQAITVDIDKDGTSDQICAVKKTSEQNIFLIPGIQNPITTEYTRLQPIRTGVTQTRTLLFYSLDILGDHSSALICSGMTADNMQLLSVYIPLKEKTQIVGYTTVADLRADGSITIQEIARSDAYNLALTKGDSYPIYPYNSNPDSPQTLDQIERVYRWDPAVKRYEQISESKIEGKRIESKMVAQLQSGDLDSFEEFLGGLWYMPSTSQAEGNKYLYFNPPDHEIIFNNGSIEEIYVRESGSARRYGAYLTTHNESIPSMSRLINIELTGIDEIKISILEDVKLKIGVASDWDGVYRKMAANSTMPKNNHLQSIQDIQETLDSSTNNWVSVDGQAFYTDNGRNYTLTDSDGKDAGSYALMTVQGQPVIQLRSSSKKADNKTRFYLIETTRKIPEGKTAASGAENQTLRLTKVTVTVEGTNLAGSPPEDFSRSADSSRIPHP